MTKVGAMPKIDESAKAWQKSTAARIGRAVQSRRRELKLTAASLAARCAELGYPISRVAVGKIESGHREGKLDVAELLALAAALDIPPISLVYPAGPDALVEMTPGEQVPTYHAIAWFGGDRDLAWPGPEIVDPAEARDRANSAVAEPDSRAATLLRLMRQRAGLARDLVLSRFVSKRDAQSWTDEQVDEVIASDARLIAKIDEITDSINTVLSDKEMPNG